MSGVRNIPTAEENGPQLNRGTGRGCKRTGHLEERKQEMPGSGGFVQDGPRPAKSGVWGPHLRRPCQSASAS